MIILHHNFDETKFMWLWARYVTSGNIEKHCVNSIPGKYSKKFSGASNHDLLSQPVLAMDEAAEGTYKAIYFCGVLKKGYLHKDPLQNNYPHNVHFAVRPQAGAHDVYDFENWHVEIDGGVLERIPDTYELKEKFFTQEPYTSHYYTCRIFRWMIGHFFPNELQGLYDNLPEGWSKGDVDNELSDGFNMAKSIFENEDETNENNIWLKNQKQLDAVGLRIIGRNRCARVRKELLGRNLLTRDYVRNEILGTEERTKYFRIGVEEYLEQMMTYEDRVFINL